MGNQLFAAGRPVVATLVAAFVLVGAAPQGSTSAPAVTPPDALSAYDRQTAGFIENRGQLDDEVRYYAQGRRYAFYLTRDRALLSFLDSSARNGVTLALGFPGSSGRGGPRGLEQADGDVNYFRGVDPTAWRTGVMRYAKVGYRDLWPGIDLHLADHAGTLKYEFRVKPGALPSNVRLQYAGARSLSIDASGTLLIDTDLGVLRDAAPVSYQIVEGRRVPVASRFVVIDAARKELGFSLDGYRPDHELVIDPGIQCSTFLGGSSDDLVGGHRSMRRVRDHANRLMKNASVTREKGQGTREKARTSADTAGSPFSLVPFPLSATLFQQPAERASRRMCNEAAEVDGGTSVASASSVSVDEVRHLRSAPFVIGVAQIRSAHLMTSPRQPGHRQSRC